jgi:hypothetical protein
MVTARHSPWVGSFLIAALALAPGCEDKQVQKKSEIEKADGAAPRAAGVDKNIAEAVAAVAGGKAGPGAGSGPPESGVFAAGAAEHEIRPGEPPKLALGGKGSGATVQFLTAAPKSGKKLEGQIEVAVQTGPRSAMPTVDLLLSFEPAAPKAVAEGAPPGPVELVGRVMAARLAKDQPGELPPGLDQQIARARGSRIRFELAPSGTGRVVGVEVSKDFDESLGQIVRSASDGLSLAFLPYPTEPVGVGAFWMVTSRESFAGLDVVSYRMMKLDRIDGPRATISVSTKRYVAGGQVGFAGIPPHKVVEFSGTTTGQVVVPVGNPAALQGELADAIVANIVAQQAPQAPPAPQARLSIHLEIRMRFALAEH